MKYREPNKTVIFGNAYTRTFAACALLCMWCTALFIPCCCFLLDRCRRRRRRAVVDAYTSIDLCADTRSSTPIVYVCVRGFNVSPSASNHFKEVFNHLFRFCFLLFLQQQNATVWFFSSFFTFNFIDNFCRIHDKIKITWNDGVMNIRKTDGSSNKNSKKKRFNLCRQHVFGDPIRITHKHQSFFSSFCPFCPFCSFDAFLNGRTVLFFSLSSSSPYFLFCQLLLSSYFNLYSLVWPKTHICDMCIHTSLALYI